MASNFNQLKDANVTVMASWYRKLALAKESGLSLRALAKEVSEKIALGNIPAYEGARLIWCIWERLGKPSQLSPFVGWASEYNDYKFLLKYLEPNELSTAKVLINNRSECLNDIVTYSKQYSNQ
jgi:hypothetical protein